MTTEVMSFALAVAEPGSLAGYIGPDNKSAGFADVATAVASGRSFMVKAKASVFAIDLDVDVVTNPERVIEWLAENEQRFIRCSSGRPGHEHVWVRVGGHTREAIRDGLIQGTGISPAQVRFGYTRPPLAPHRNGLPVALIEPLSAPEALAVLGYRPSPPGLSPKVLGLLRDGDVRGEYKTRRAVLFAIALGFWRARIGYTAFRAAVFDPGNKGAAKLHDDVLPNEGRDKAEAYLSRLWSEARAVVDGTPDFTAETARAAIGPLLSEVTNWTWPGRAGRTDQKVMTALCLVALDAGTLSVASGLRRLCDAGNLGSPLTVSRSLARLVAAGWIVREPKEGTHVPDSYRLVLDRAIIGTSVGCAPITSNPTDGSILTHLAFRERSGLGQSPGLIWLVLRREGPQGRKRLVDLTGMSARTVSRALQELARYGLAVSESGSWSASGEVEDLDRLAEELGVGEVKERQAQRFAAERRRQAEFANARHLPTAQSMAA